MSKFPIICGVLGKKLYLVILLALTLILHFILRFGIFLGYDTQLFYDLLIKNPKLINERQKLDNLQTINNLGGNILEMLSVFIPYIFKLKSKSEASSKKCTKANFKDYFILFLICLLFVGVQILLNRLKIYNQIITLIWVSLSFQMILYIILSIIILKAKYYIHNIISSILYCLFSVIIDLF